MTTKTKAVSDLSDAEVLELAGPFGPSIIGKDLYERAQSIAKRGDDGKLGPAITDPDYAYKLPAKKKTAAKESESTEETGSGDSENSTEETAGGAWHHVSLSGLKIIAQNFGVSHKPRPTRAELIELLTVAKVAPPPVPEIIEE
jgi:hypothetical protein